MTDANENKSAPPPKAGPEPHAAGGDELANVMRLAREYGQSIVIGVAAAALIYVGYNYWTGRKTSAAADAARMLDAARTPEQRLAVVKNYPSTAAAAAALLAVAADYYQVGQFAPARDQYDEFLKRFPKHAMRGAAEVNRLQCLEGETRYDEALKGYESFLAAEAKHFMAPLAVFGKGRCLESQGRFDEARAVYEDFTAANPASPWREQAEASLNYANQRQRALMAPAGGAPSPAPAPAIATPPAALAPSAAP